MEHKIFDIHERIFQFVVAVLIDIRLVNKSTENQIILNQLIRSVTSVGANDQEADGVSTKRDFIHCYTVVRKELKESRYWLRLISELDSSYKSRLEVHILEADELVKILSVIIRNAALPKN